MALDRHRGARKPKTTSRLYDLALTLGVPAARLEEALRREGVRLIARAHGLSLSDALPPAIAERVVRKLRRLEPTARMRVTGSKYWVSGYRELVKQWHPTKNAGLFPDEVSYASRATIWWKCPKGPDHEWSTRVHHRTKARRPTGCPFCDGKRVSVTNSLAARRPRVAAEWHPTRNGRLRPTDITSGSSRRVWWKCPKGEDHVWRVSPDQRIRFDCPFCKSRSVARATSLAATRPALAAEWHPTRNGKVRPSKFMPSSHRIVWWKCPGARDHEWRASIAARSKGAGCPCCKGSRVSRTNSLAKFPEIASQWDMGRNGGLQPEQINGGTTRRFWWKCSRGPDHRWQAVVQHRTSQGLGCPFCANVKVSVTNCLATKDPALAREWHLSKNESLTPRDVVPGSTRVVWWRCSLVPRHVWRTQIRRRAVAGGSCPECRESARLTA